MIWAGKENTRRRLPLSGTLSVMPDARLVDSKATFTQLAHILDARILRALADLGFARPTLVQTKAIPLALENRDILARARTGSGKTAAYCIPLVQKVLNAKSVRPPSILRSYCIIEYKYNGILVPVFV